MRERSGVTDPAGRTIYRSIGQPYLWLAFWVVVSSFLVLVALRSDSLAARIGAIAIVCFVWYSTLVRDCYEVTLDSEGGLEFRSLLRRKRTTAQAVTAITFDLFSDGWRSLSVKYEGGSATLSFARRRDLVGAILKLNPDVELDPVCRRAWQRQLRHARP